MRKFHQSQNVSNFTLGAVIYTLPFQHHVELSGCEHKENCVPE
jgi:hypothetical protein